MQIDVRVITTLLSGGGNGYSALQALSITDEGDLVDRRTFGSADIPVAGLTHGENVSSADGNQVVYGTVVGTDGIVDIVFNSAGQVTKFDFVPDTAATFAADVSAVAAIDVISVV